MNVRRSARTGHACFVSAVNKGGIPVRIPQTGNPIKPIDFFVEHGSVFGIGDAKKQLRFSKVHTDVLGHTHTTYKQIHKSVRVFGGVLKAHQNSARQFIAANGHFFPVSSKLSAKPTIDSKEAKKIAQLAFGQEGSLVEHSELVIVDPGWYGDPSIGPHLAYYVIVNNSLVVVREAFFIDAHSGTVLDRWNMIHSARDRQIHDANGSSSIPGPLARVEGQGVTGIADVDKAYDYAGDTYDYYFRAFGRDSLDDNGMPIIVTVRSTVLPCPNAAWNGHQVVFCSGLVTDDVMAHELAHAVTEYTADLVYQNQSGQLNESISDIFGELVDLFNGDAAFAGPPGGLPNWPTHPSGPGTDTPNGLRSVCSTTSNGFADGYRWLIAEDASVGPFRDMWDPTCMGDPDRANSPLQTCPSSDNGGVHSGSGTPNHAFAIMTDGKTFNGQVVTGIGPIKAGAVWYRALTTYLTVASDFEDAYLALNQAAQDLIGTDPNDPRTGLPSGDTFTLFDAEQVDKALLAVEMNTEGACGASVDILDSTPPDQCGPPRTIIFADDFEGGINGWSVSNTNPPTPYDWEQIAGSLPFGRSGTVWFIADANVGDCMSQYESAVHYLTSPTITMPVNPIHPTLAFTHYIASEPGWDGGNVKIKVNSGTWQLIPTSAFEYNPYNTTINSALQGNTNPLKGQSGWSGASGQWGTSLINLSDFVSSSDTIQIRFDFGKDDCNGLDGWYLDDFELYTCPPEPPTAINRQVGTLINTPINIALPANDEGEPDPPGQLTMIITSLPVHGTLNEPNVGLIDSIPYSLISGNNEVTYQPETDYQGSDSFKFKADDGGTPPTGGESNEATITITVSDKDYFTELFTGAGHPFDLDYHAMMFTPNGSSNFYDVSLQPITELPTDPAGGGSPSFLFEDGSDLFIVAGGETVSIYGRSYSLFWFSSNGFITFDTFDIIDLGMSEESLAGHFNKDVGGRISALFDDLSPPSGGTWSWKEFVDRIAITWENIPEKGTSNSNTFQVELYFDGRIQIAWLNIDAQDGLVGLSNGEGIPVDFAETDLSTYRSCNQPGDYDYDCDVDHNDFLEFESCASGPAIPLNPGCEDKDFDSDNDVDQNDFAIFQRCYSGENNPADPNCAD
jgi:Zn-dependent metalloprotease